MFAQKYLSEAKELTVSQAVKFINPEVDKLVVTDTLKINFIDGSTLKYDCVFGWRVLYN